MTPAIAVPSSGLTGWKFLKATTDRQLSNLENSGSVKRKLEYFFQNISSVKSAEDLIGDRRLLDVALGAFGLQDDIANKAFIKKVLSEGTIDDTSFANRLADKRYFEMSKSFGFDLTPPNTIISTFPGQIAEKYLRQTFEVAAGDVDPDLRLALSFERTMPELANSTTSEDAFWFTVMGTPTLRRVFETAMSIPPAASGIDLDQQLEIFKSKAARIYGSSEPKAIAEVGAERIVTDFLLRAQAAAISSSIVKGSVALSLLQSTAPRLF